MFCPQCGTSPCDELNFCKSCGANLQGVRHAMVSRGDGNDFEWSKTWVAEMFLSGPELKLRREEVDRRLGITPEMKRAREVKAGVITAASGLGLAIVLYVLMQGVIAGGTLSPVAAEILSRLWVIGVIPIMVGFGLMINGLGVNKLLLGSAGGNSQAKPAPLPPGARSALPSPNTNELNEPSPFGVTEGTTRHLEGVPLKK